MSFLKFTGKKSSNKKSEELDLPPLPPPLKGPETKGDLPEHGPPLPDDDLTEPKGFPEEPKMPESPDTSLPEFPEMPSEPEMPPLTEPPEEEVSVEEPQEETASLDSQEKPPETKQPTGPIYIKIDTYKDVLREINKIKADFERSENILSSMVEIKASEDKELESWKHGLEDIRKRLSFIDTSVFEGS